MKEVFDLRGRVALVTGGSRGLGFGIAQGLAEAGCSVVVASRNLEEASEAAQKLTEKYGVETMAFRCDVSNYEEVKKLLEAVKEKFGKLDTVVNAAGINRRHPAEEFPLDEFRQVIEVNLFGTYYVCREAFSLLRESDNPSIINIGSLTVEEVTMPNISAYAASKGGVASLTKALAKEWGRYGIRVNVIAPGWYRTKMTEAVFSDPEKLDYMLKRIPLGRTGVPEDLKGVAVFLASEEAKYVTGQIIFVDGGWTAN
ncbi:short-chain dehydrogenase [Thermotoga maritima MSB8]|uniref:Oxidoreductase, short chain dehydrogenase/reductase family n=2 Tax=Thermotoga TaxID=2335 RepID=Q9WYS2_THEMA|nr:SDR family oxidoreductase [Thermotoga maritima]AAD35526.1 oxidoreductase, short chain dehydrogenase/reductase family [Thermotoga maritima MSB8]AHD17801.1 short-chain dehydrogenase [Thermotoga maritima MSB8]